MTDNLNRRILVIDDNQAIHDDFRKILGESDSEDAALQAAESRIFGAPATMLFEIDTASQGEEGLKMVEKALAEGRPYAMAFVDVRMPPGWDGIETTQRIWQICPELQVVICTAFSDCSWSEMQEQIDPQDRLLVLKKPFDTIEILQMANALTQKWLRMQESKVEFGDLHQMVSERTRELEASQAAAVSMMADAVRHREKAELSYEELKREMAERRRLEEKFREQASLLDKAQDAILAHDLEHRITYWNKGAERLYGWSAQEVAGRSVAQMLYKDSDAFQRACEQVIKTGEWVGELHQVGKDGGSLVIVGHWTLVRDAAGQPKSVLTINTDITGRKKTDEALKMQGQVLESMAEGVTVCDEKGHIVFSNDSCNTMFGYEGGELIGQHYSVIRNLPQEEGRQAMDELFRVLREKGAWMGEMSSRKKNGAAFITRSRISVLEMDGVRSFVAVVEDITEKKNMEAQFLRSQRMESVGRLSSGIAHDMNNILTPIFISSFMLRRNLPPDEFEKMLGNIETNAQRGADLIKQLLTVNCDMSGQRHVVEASRLAADMMKIMSGTFPKNISLTGSTPDDVWPVIGDPTQLHQVLLNLCVNARDAMPAGGVLSLTTENIRLDENFAAMNVDAMPGPYVVIRVSDTGEGIPVDVIDKIFDPFFTTKETGKGTGLGLSTVLGIVKSHQGFVNLRSHVSMGSIFEIYLPAAPDAVAASIAAPPMEAPRGQGELILVVDDEEVIREVVQKTLCAHGYRVITAGDGTEAIAQFSQNRGEVKAVLTDIMMPFMDGVTLSRTLKKMDPSVQIIATSGMGSAKGRQDKATALASLQINTFLNKPYSANEILTAISELLASDRSSLVCSELGLVA
ncbi:PAS domain S-box protein [Prosthecobacter sp.]|uniref:PAS domain S-box protein n=1 Tax=Prosthecobacter sp. TaxID=1965333 RepID=UPI0024874806|nr:PAS domain S-box protein [Prosthecobacter sp.]MDI1315596.1 PAS domain S-box protein [Prosthecobacter sp.]